MILDKNKLEGIKLQPGDCIQCMCPACAEQGRNLKSKDHLRVWETGPFNCVVDSSKEHNQRIIQLVGINGVAVISNNDSIYIAEEPKTEIISSWNIEILDKLIKNYDYWNNRGISDETCKKFKIGLAIKGQLNQRSIIPIVDKVNLTKIAGFSARALHKDQKPKYKILGKKSTFVFPAFDEEISKSNSILLVEGAADAMYLYEHGIRCTMCLFGVTVSPAVLGYIIRMNPAQILIGTNNDINNESGNVGLKAAEKLVRQLSQFFNEDRIRLAMPEGEYKDFAEYSKEKLREYKQKWNL